jgi:hypothetical protein
MPSLVLSVGEGRHVWSEVDTGSQVENKMCCMKGLSEVYGKGT